jgi:hypothetical protein
MIEIYWIEMLDGINFLLILTGIIILIVAAIMIATSFGGEDYDKKYEDDLSLRKSGIKILFLSLILFIICALIPNTRQAYRIYGVSAAIDYLKDNGEAKQLPDKAVKVLNKWDDDYLEEDSIK